eukprot:tig00020509_g9747.t1
MRGKSISDQVEAAELLGSTESLGPYVKDLAAAWRAALVAGDVKVGCMICGEVAPWTLSAFVPRCIVEAIADCIVAECAADAAQEYVQVVPLVDRDLSAEQEPDADEPSRQELTCTISELLLQPRGGKTRKAGELWQKVRKLAAEKLAEGGFACGDCLKGPKGFNPKDGYFSIECDLCKSFHAFGRGKEDFQACRALGAFLCFFNAVWRPAATSFDAFQLAETKSKDELLKELELEARRAAPPAAPAASGASSGGGRGGSRPGERRMRADRGSDGEEERAGEGEDKEEDEDEDEEPADPSGKAGDDEEGEEEGGEDEEEDGEEGGDKSGARRSARVAASKQAKEKEQPPPAKKQKLQSQPAAKKARTRRPRRDGAGGASAASAAASSKQQPAPGPSSSSSPAAAAVGSKPKGLTRRAERLFAHGSLKMMARALRKEPAPGQPAAQLEGAPAPSAPPRRRPPRGKEAARGPGSSEPEPDQLDLPPVPASGGGSSDAALVPAQPPVPSVAACLEVLEGGGGAPVPHASGSAGPAASAVTRAGRLVLDSFPLREEMRAKLEKAQGDAARLLLIAASAVLCGYRTLQKLKPVPLAPSNPRPSTFLAPLLPPPPPPSAPCLPLPRLSPPPPPPPSPPSPPSPLFPPSHPSPSAPPPRPRAFPPPEKGVPKQSWGKFREAYLYPRLATILWLAGLVLDSESKQRRAFRSLLEVGHLVERYPHLAHARNAPGVSFLHALHAIATLEKKQLQDYKAKLQVVADANGWALIDGLFDAEQACEPLAPPDEDEQQADLSALLMGGDSDD